MEPQCQLAVRNGLFLVVGNANEHMSLQVGVVHTAVFLLSWNGWVCVSKASQASCTSLPSPPGPDGVSLGLLMNIDMGGPG